MKKEFSIVLLFSRDSPFVHECLANFRSLLVDFHEYTLNMTSYHVTEAINGHF